jgi:uncharacterized repeat protein (TIGR01451 family)
MFSYFHIPNSSIMKRIYLLLLLLFPCVHVFADCIIDSISGPTSVCVGSTISLSDGTISGGWTSSDASIATVDGGGNVTGVSTGTAAITYTVSSTCGTFSSFKLITVVDTATATISGDSSVCIGSAVTLSTDFYGGAWSSSSPSVASVDSLGLVTGVSSGTADITYSGTAGCGFSGLMEEVVGISSSIVPVDTNCSISQFNVAVCSGDFSVSSFFGDGASDSSYFPGLTGSVFHTYATTGAYTVKQIIYRSGTAIDTTIYTYYYTNCQSLPIKFYLDDDSDCTFSASTDRYAETAVAVEVDSSGVVLDTLSATSGLYYHALGTTGDVYAFKVLSTATTGFAVICPHSGEVYDTIGLATPVKYFGLACGGDGFDLSVNASMIAGRHIAYANILVSNSHCTAENATLTMHFSPKYVLDTTATFPSPLSHSGTTITWNIDSVSGISTDSLYFHAAFTIPTSTWLTEGDTVHSDYTVTPMAGDIDTTNNFVALVDTVKGSYDPNYIDVQPSGYISAGTTLHYAINFENTGNDTAFNIHVMDTLPNTVDMHSLRIVAASAVMNTMLFTDSLHHNIVKFDFPGIDLLDSSHHAGCNGSVFFTINTKTGLPDGTTIPNHAGIFFDYNPVVMTDTVVNIIGTPKSTHVQSVTTPDVMLFPNPANNTLILQTAGAAYRFLTISNSIGTPVMQHAISGTTSTINVQSLPAGVYIVALKGDHTATVVRFTKL